MFSSETFSCFILSFNHFKKTFSSKIGFLLSLVLINTPQSTLQIRRTWSLSIPLSRSAKFCSGRLFATSRKPGILIPKALFLFSLFLWVSKIHWRVFSCGCSQIWDWWQLERIEGGKTCWMGRIECSNGRRSGARFFHYLFLVSSILQIETSWFRNRDT